MAPSGLIAGKAPGQTPRLTGEHRAALAGMMEDGPIPAVRWRRALAARRSPPMGVRGMPRRRLGPDDEQGVGGHGLAQAFLLRPRHHAQAANAIEGFKQASHRARKRSRARRGVDPGSREVWFADEARVGQKNKIPRRWAKRGTRPSAPSDQRTASTYIFGAIRPKEGKAVGLILPKCNTEAMPLHLDEIANDVSAWMSRRPACRSGGMAYVRQARRPR